MDQYIVPAVWYATAEAAEFYAETFYEGSTVEWAPGLAAMAGTCDFRLSLIDGGNQYVPNPSISYTLNFDSLPLSGEKQVGPILISPTNGSALAAPS